MKDFMSIGTDFQSIYFTSTIFLKDKINGVHVTQFQLAYIIDTTHPSHKTCLSCAVKYIICGVKINLWNYMSGRIAEIKIKQEY